MIRAWGSRLLLACAALIAASPAALAQVLPGKTADGIVGTADGGILFAQEQGDTIRELDMNNHESVYLTDTPRAGCMPFSAPARPRPAEQRLLANSFGDGRPLGRLNDLADGSTRTRRQFGTLAGDTGGDGMAIDAAGRLYVGAASPGRPPPGCATRP
jgi:hypothetical protein